MCSASTGICNASSPPSKSAGSRPDPPRPRRQPAAPTGCAPRAAFRRGDDALYHALLLWYGTAWTRQPALSRSGRSRPGTRSLRPDVVPTGVEAFEAFQDEGVQSPTRDRNGITPAPRSMPQARATDDPGRTPTRARGVNVASKGFDDRQAARPWHVYGRDMRSVVQAWIDTISPDTRWSRAADTPAFEELRAAIARAAHPTGARISTTGRRCRRRTSS